MKQSLYYLKRTDEAYNCFQSEAIKYISEHKQYKKATHYNEILIPLDSISVSKTWQYFIYLHAPKISPQIGVHRKQGSCFFFIGKEAW